MKTPFVFGRIAINEDFTDRVVETERLTANFSSLTNTILISPRRWGKSSLVARAAEKTSAKNKNIQFCLIDLNNVRTEEQFYQELATEILKRSTTKIEKVIETTKKFLSRFIPSISYSPSPESNFSISLDWKEVKKHPGEILDLAENIGSDTKQHFIICVDEFQNISEFENPLAFQKMLRAHWQKHQYVSYCLFGSKRHMLMDVFTSPSMPFYKFGDILFLQKIAVNDWVSFIVKRFNETGKKIGEPESALIAEYAECHPYYVQQLAQQSWLRANTTCTKKIVTEAFEDLTLQLSMLFQTITDSLNNSQVNFLRALTNNVKQLSSQSAIQEYQLGTSANVLKIKKGLVSKEIIDINQGAITFLDPFYKYWLKKYYFKHY